MSTRLSSLRAPATCSASAVPRRAASARTASTSASASSRRSDRLRGIGREGWFVSGRARSAATRASGEGPDDPSSDVSPRATATDAKPARGGLGRGGEPCEPSSSSASGVDDDDGVENESAEQKVDLLQEFRNGVLFGETMRKRFTEARIDDKGLPIADALVVTTVPVFVATCVLALGVPRPSWLVPAPWIPKWRSLPFLVPALSHGAKLSCAWIPGALAAKAYEREAYDGSVDEAVRRTVKAGCFAIGILILATQIQLSAEFAAAGLPPPQLGDSPETDLLLNGVASELIADCAFEAVGLIAWRVVRCTTDIPPDEERWY